MQSAIGYLATTCLIASLAVLLVLAGSSQTIWDGPQSEAKATGSLIVDIKPIAARQDGARWRVDGGVWQRSGRTVSGLSVGKHTVTFKTIVGWDTPKQKKPAITANQTTALSGKYVMSDTGTIMLPGDVPLELVWIPAGSFMMGRYTNEQGSSSNEDPQHQVTLAQGFWLGKYELTKAQWQAVMNTTPWSGQSYIITDPNSPAVYVSWNNAQLFITALNTHITNTGQGAATFRLPSEAQWEYACRAGTTWRFYWGDDLTYTQIGNYAWWDGNADSVNQDYAHIVGLKLPNARGLYDMSGNVWEWCEDWIHSSYTGAPTDGSAWVSPTGSLRVGRGGGWFGGGFGCRSANRSYYAPSGAYYYIGFRLAR
jgi:formylglycine-generating enzyme required for sulfatase activity